LKKKLLGALALFALVAAPALAEAATRGFSTANVNMRSGPSTAYPAVVVIPNGAPLTIHGCLSDTPWCDVSFTAGRGWVAGRYVQAIYRENRIYVEPRSYRNLGVPIITFDAGNYWDRYYRDRDFYRERDRWRRPPPSGGYWNAAPPRGDWRGPPPRQREEWRDGRRDDWRDGRRDDRRDDGRDGRRDDRRGPNDGRWEERNGNWDQNDRQRPPRGDDNRRRDDNRQRDENRQQFDNRQGDDTRPQFNNERRGRSPDQEQNRNLGRDQQRAPDAGGCRPGDPSCVPQ